MKRWRIAGINFDHMHMEDNLRMAFEHPDVDIVGLCDEMPERMTNAARHMEVPENKLFTDYHECLEETEPDIVLLCPAAARHGEWVEKVAPYGVHIIIEKPFAASLIEADAMIQMMGCTKKLMAINWPLAWYPCHVTAKRLVDKGTIGEVVEVHYYDGNRGPLYHTANKAETSAEDQDNKKDSWFYKKDYGGGALLDYLGYGATLGTWFMDNRVPLEVTTVVDQTESLEVDEHSVTVARYASGLSKFETRWGTFTDPWVFQPQPKCGFVLVGTQGTISSYDYEDKVYLQTRDCLKGRKVPVDVLEPPHQNVVQYFIHCLETGRAIEGPISPEVARIGQQIVDSAMLSAKEKRTVPLVDNPSRQPTPATSRT